MIAGDVRPELRVEAPEDKNALIHLLIRNGIDYDAKPWPAEFPNVVEVPGAPAMLAGMELAVRVGGARTVGFVLDADSPLSIRWDEVRTRLASAAVAAPLLAPAEGFIGQSGEYRTRVGVWLMPDNQEDGTLESLLHTLVEDHGPLIGHAEEATDRARHLGARFPDADRLKALLHTWLAWQEEPGYPYGTAIRVRYFRHDSPAALAFVAWFRKLFGISRSGGQPRCHTWLPATVCRQRRVT